MNDSWSPSGCRSQTSMVMLIRRATRYDPPASQSPAGSSPSPTHTCSSSASVSSALTFMVPSLKPNRLRGVDCDGRRGRGPAEPELRPPHGDGAEPDPGQVADRVHRHLRVVGAGLDAEVAVRAELVEVVAREVRQLLERRGTPVGQPEPVLAVLVDEQRRPEAERDRQPGRRQTDRLAGVVGRQVVGAVERTDRSGGAAARHPLGGVGPRLQQLDQVLARRRRDVERREVQPVLGRGGDPGLVGAPERVGALGPLGPGLVRRRRRSARTRRRRARRRPRLRRHRRRSGRVGRWSVRTWSAQHHGGELGQRLGQRVDGVGELLDLVLGEVVVVREAVRRSSARRAGPGARRSGPRARRPGRGRCARRAA